MLTGAGGAPPEASLDRTTVEDFTAVGDGSWVSDEVAASDVVLVGATVEADAAVEVRAHDGDGWGPWLAFPEVDDHGSDDPDHRHGHDGHPPDDGRGEHDRVELDPVWVGASERLQLRARGDDPGLVHLDTVAMPPDRMLANRPVTTGRGAALASTGDPQIIPRDAWDPDGECRPTEPPESGEVEMAHIHHTVMYPTYAPEEADDVVRALCLFHVEARGFSDLGYNFMVDAYGRVYEGRAGGIDRAVVGSHAAGFNHVSAGISVMGDHETDPVSDETVRAIEELLAWLFITHRVDPLGTTVVESTGGAVPGLTRFEEGEEVELPTIVGHKDTGNETLCPGRHLYAAMEDVPPRVAELVLAAAQDVGTGEEPPDVGPRSAGEDDVVEAAPPSAGPTLPVTGWGGIALGLLTLGTALLVGERRWRVPGPPADRSGRDPVETT